MHSFLKALLHLSVETRSDRGFHRFVIDKPALHSRLASSIASSFVNNPKG